MTHARGTILRSTAALALLLGALACSSPADPAPATGARHDLPEADSLPGGPSIGPALADIAYAELRAWEDTRRGLPPLRVVRPDSVAALVAFMESRRATGWTTVPGALPGIALPIEFWRDGALVARVGVINTAHGQGGYLVAWDNARAATRPISADEFQHLLAFFGMGVVTVP